MVRPHPGCDCSFDLGPKMPNPQRPLAFVLAATDHGTMLVNRFDRHITTTPPHGIGVGFQLLEHAAYDPDEVKMVLKLLDLRRQHYGNGAIAIDCGANIGVHTVEWAKHMTGWGVVLAFEAQEWIYYALAGNIAINNCFNARAIHAAVTGQSGTMKMPAPNYLAAASFGSLELKKRDNNEFIGQPIDYAEDKMVDVRAVHLDSFHFHRLDLLKIDIEGMELEALAGAAGCIAANRPIVLVEMLKSNPVQLQAWLEALDYRVFHIGGNFVAVHKADKGLAQIEFVPAVAA
jgi:FkbM family methyltransferase